jgi:hypothetical protein
VVAPSILHIVGGNVVVGQSHGYSERVQFILQELSIIISG